MCGTPCRSFCECDSAHTFYLLALRRRDVASLLDKVGQSEDAVDYATGACANAQVCIVVLCDVLAGGGVLECAAGGAR